MIRFSCPACGRVTEVSDADAGHKMDCPGCGQRVEVPAPGKTLLGKLEPTAGGPESARPRLSASAEPDAGLVAIEDCPECGKALQVPESDVGRRVSCPRCSEVFVARKLRAGGRDGDDDRAERQRDERDEDDEDDRRDRGRRYCPECGEPVSRRDRYCPECGATQPDQRDPAVANAASKKIAAGVCAIIIGGFGIHKFVLGYTNAGVIMLLATLLTCFIGYPVMHIIGIVEGIIYLTRSDDDFYRTYIVGRREWF